MVKTKYVPQRMDIVWVDFNPTRGHEQAHVRPALVLSPRAYNQKTHMVLVCPITSQIKGYPFEVIVQEKKITGAVLADQVRSLDWTCRNVCFIQKLSPVAFEEVREKIHVLIF
jgi:mRNA interferase MazF